MKYLALFVVLCAVSAFGQNSYGTDYLTFHCTAPDPNAPPNFGDLPKPGLVPNGAPSGNAILYCDYSAGALKLSFNGGAYATFGGGLPAGLTFVSPAFTISTAGSGSGVLALSGNTSGTATLTAPAVAGTITNAVASSNVMTFPQGTTSTGQMSLGIASAGTGINFNASNSTDILAGNVVQTHVSTSFVTFTPPICDAASGNNCFTFAAGKITLTGSAAPNLGFGQGKGQHFITQAATSDTAGVCSGTTTTCTVAFTTNYTSTPSCVVTPTTAGVTSFIITSQANTGFTVTYAPSATTNFNYICIGNPN